MLENEYCKHLEQVKLNHIFIVFVLVISLLENIILGITSDNCRRDNKASLRADVRIANFLTLRMI